MTMLANALSHTLLLGIVVAYLIMWKWMTHDSPLESVNLTFLMIAAVAAALLTTFLTEILTRWIKLQEDASIGLVFTTLFALGILLVTLFTRNVHVGTELVMGNVDALQKQDLSLVYATFGCNLVLFLALFKEFKLTTFDPSLASALGFSPTFFNYLIMLLTAATAVASFRAVGVLMVLAFFVLPPLLARLVTHSLSVLLLVAGGVGVLASLTSVALSRHLLSYYGVGLSTGGVTVVVLLIFYAITAFFVLARLAFHRSRLKQQQY